MVKTYKILVLIFLLVSGCKTESKIEKSTILNAQEARFKAMVDDDFKSLEKLLSDDLTYGHTTGLTETKTDLINSIKSKKFDYLSFKSRNIKVKIYKKTATITCIADVKLMLKTGPLSLTIKILEVHKLVDKNWLLTSYQSVRYSEN